MTANHQIPHLKLVTAALIVHDERVLISQRFPESHLGGYWEFPGGKMEADESPEACLVREIEEETGMRISVGSIARAVFYRYPTFNILLLAYWCEWLAGAPTPIGCQALRWVRPKEIRDVLFPPADTPIIEDLQRVLGDW